MVMVGGVPRSPTLEGMIRAREHDAKVAGSAQREQERIAAERSKILANAPKLDSGTGAVLLGADRKCLDQAIEVSKMEGLEKWKRIAELVSYGCVFTVDRLTPVRVEAAEGSYSRVTPIDGPKTGQTRQTGSEKSSAIWTNDENTDEAVRSLHRQQRLSGFPLSRQGLSDPSRPEGG